jgi:hypothetical protein
MDTLFRKNLSHRSGYADAFEHEVITNDKELWIEVALESLCDAGERLRLRLRLEVLAHN